MNFVALGPPLFLVFVVLWLVSLEINCLFRHKKRFAATVAYWLNGGIFLLALYVGIGSSDSAEMLFKDQPTIIRVIYPIALVFINAGGAWALALVLIAVSDLRQFKFLLSHLTGQVEIEEMELANPTESSRSGFRVGQWVLSFTFLFFVTSIAVHSFAVDHHLEALRKVALFVLVSSGLTTLIFAVWRYRKRRNRAHPNQIVS